jgi:hypothetical protein
MTDPAYQQIAAALRQEIHAGRLGPGSRLPTQQQLAEVHGVGRDTVREAVQLLRAEGLLEDGRPGRPAAVARGISRAQPLHWHIERAFQADRVTLDVWSLHPQGLSNAMAKQADLLRRSERRPSAIHCRVMLPDLNTDFRVPVLVGTPRDPRPRERLRSLIRTYAGHLEDTLHTLAEDQVVPDVDIQIRGVPYLPTEKRYLINDSLVLTGYYHLRQALVTNKPDGTLMRVHELYGDDLLFPTVQNRQDSPMDEALFLQVQRSFTSHWNQMATRLQLGS